MGLCKNACGRSQSLISQVVLDPARMTMLIITTTRSLSSQKQAAIYKCFYAVFTLGDYYSFSIFSFLYLLIRMRIGILFFIRIKNHLY